MESSTKEDQKQISKRVEQVPGGKRPNGLKKLLFCAFMCIIIYLIYATFASKQFTYISLGDSLALGENAYGDVQYGYSDYIASYLKRNDLLAFYSKDFAKSGARIQDVSNMILKNETIVMEKERYVLTELLRNADLVTLSIGANDVLSELALTSLDLSLVKEEVLLEKVDKTIEELDALLMLLKKSTRGEVLLIGYYNPFNENAKVKRIFSYFENAYQEVARKHHVTYIQTSTLFKNHSDYLLNPFNIHPGSKGYSAIANQVITYLEENLLNSLVK